MGGFWEEGVIDIGPRCRTVGRQKTSLVLPFLYLDYQLAIAKPSQALSFHSRARTIRYL